MRVCFCFSTGQPSVHRQRVRPWWRQKMRQQCISTSLSFASERTAERRTHQRPLLNRGWGLRGGSGPCLLFLPAHFGPAAKRERDSVEKAKQEKRSWSHRIVAFAARTRDMKSTWNLHGSTFEGLLPARKITELAPANAEGKRSHEL